MTMNRYSRAWEQTYKRSRSRSLVETKMSRSGYTSSRESWCSFSEQQARWQGHWIQRATSPLARSLERSAERNEHDIDPELRSYLRELHDRVLRVEEPTEGFRDMLSDILVVNLTLIGVRQNDQTKKISAWAAILIVPTLITGIYGMNFDFMPELHWTFGYPLALALMVSICVGLYAVFRHVRWL